MPVFLGFDSAIAQISANFLYGAALDFSVTVTVASDPILRFIVAERLLLVRHAKPSWRRAVQGGETFVL